jgi:hypothetical protein
MVNKVRTLTGGVVSIPDAVLMDEEASEILAVLCSQQERYRVAINRACQGATMQEQDRIDSSSRDQEDDASLLLSRWRRQLLCAWAYRVIDHLGLPRDTVALAFNYTDRFMALHPACAASEPHLKLAVTASIFIACKTYHNAALEGGSKKLLEMLEMVSRGELTESMILKMEMVLLRTMRFLVHPPLPYHFVHHLLKLPAAQSLSNGELQQADLQLMQETAQYFTEIAVLETLLVDVPPSLVAAAALFNAAKIHNERRVNDPYIDYVKKILSRIVPGPSIGTVKEIGRILWAAVEDSQSSSRPLQPFNHILCVRSVYVSPNTVG